ncbi:TAXI family TRAP transporter solute-binding subunit [Halomonas sp. M5N1S17]|uniref:TAXI family TRAP transporter solute-binding subunit n=1 Tax=Halomonas alkalisoli TaxID=2907158 RepID=UPI001F467A19|nr:TAXI family TRAP transporter solute-binding subunit [Halomonas alkalisoli]MCE9662181.1 TAXI family TRAP transporter solute-binding subunit [Halomonas alkalisoli]
MMIPRLFRVMSVCAIGLCVTSTTAFAQKNEEVPDFVSVVGASSGGTFFFIANGVAQLLNDNIPGLRASAQSTAGTPRIFQTLNTGNGEIGFGQSSIAYDAVNGIEQFEGMPMDNLSGMTFMYPNVLQFIVRKGSGVEVPEHLAGKRLGVGEVGGGVEVSSREMFAVIDDIDFPSGISAEYVTGTQASDLLRNNQLDGANMVAALGFAAITDLMSTGDYELLSFSEDFVEKMNEEVNAAYFSFEIPAHTYPNQPDPVATYAEANWLFARKDLSDKFVYDVLEVLYGNQEYLVNLHNVNQSMTLENSQKGSMIPLHPGAVKFFEERGVEIKE